MIPVPDLAPETLRLLMEFEGKPRLKARLCEGGRYEVAYGVTYYPDGRTVGPSDTITEADVMPMTLHALAVEGAPVWRALKDGLVLTPHQAGALAVFAFNVGGSAAAGSSVVRYLNEGRFEDAAASFGSWTGATSRGPTPTEISAGTVPKFPLYSRQSGRWSSPEGADCSYFRRFRGLLRRHHAEGCLFLALDWTEAVKNDAIELAAEPRWNNVKSRWEDKIIRQTEFASVLAVARRYPLLANVPIAAEPDPPKAPAPVIEVRVEPLPEIKTLPAPLPPSAPPPPPPLKEKTVTTPAPKPAPAPATPGVSLPNDFDPNAGVKAMVFSRRFWGWVLIVVGRFSFVTDGTANLIGGPASAIAADPILLDAWTGMAVMMSGEAVRWWGEKKATKALK